MKSIILALSGLLVAPILAYVGGPCDGNYGANCICLDNNYCANTLHGRREQGSPGKYPCPHDADNIWGCFINNCKGANTVCQWLDFCEQGTIGYPLPGEYLSAVWASIGR